MTDYRIIVARYWLAIFKIFLAVYYSYVCYRIELISIFSQRLKTNLLTTNTVTQLKDKIVLGGLFLILARI